MTTKYRLITVATITAVLAAGGLAMAKDRQGGSGFHNAQHTQQRDGRGPDHRGGMMRLGNMMELYDQNQDGALTQEEIDTVRAEQLAKFDANGDGSLNLAEYQALWLDAMHEQMVDRFQSHDDDGDGQVTAEEFGERQARMVRMMDRNEDGQIDRDDFARKRVQQAPSDSE